MPRLTSLFLVPILILATGAVAADADRSVLVENRRIDVDITLSDQPRQQIRASVKYSYRLTNNSTQATTLTRHIPLYLLRQLPKDAVRIQVHGRDVPFDWRQPAGIDDPNILNRPAGGPGRVTPEQNHAWAKLLEGWLRQDAEVDQTLNRLLELNQNREEIDPLTRQFQKAIKPHLLNERDCRTAVLRIATGQGTLYDIVRVMPEVDKTLRRDMAWKNRPYIAFLNEYDVASYAPYAEEWRARIQKWLAGKPEIAAILPQLREAYESYDSATALLNGPIQKRLHDHCGLTLDQSRRVLLQLQLRRQLHTEVIPVVEHLFPRVRLQRNRDEQDFATRLLRWGFDPVRMSPITGRLYPAARVTRQHFSVLEDPSVQVLLNGGNVSQSYGFGMTPIRLWNAVGVPRVCSFEVELPAGRSATVMAKYETPILPIVHPYSSTLSLGGIDQLVGIIPPEARQGTTDIRISSPVTVLPVISPAPNKQGEVKDNVRTWRLRLEHPQQNLYLAVVDYRTPGGLGSFTHRFHPREEFIDAVRLLRKEIRNPTVTPLLVASECRLLFKMQRRGEARSLLSLLRRQHSDVFVSLDMIDWELQHEVRQAAKHEEWIRQKSRSPVFVAEEDLNHFGSTESGEPHVLHPEEIAVLAEAVRKLDENKLSVQEKLGRRFILAQADVNRAENVKGLVRVAESTPSSVRHALKLIQTLTVDKHEALPFVVSQIDLELPKKKVNSNHPDWLRQVAAYHALSSFQSPEAAPGLIQFVASTEDGLLLQGAMRSLKRMKLPDYAAELMKYSERMSWASEGAFYDYLEVLINADRNQAIQRMKAILKKHPRYKRRINSLLADLGDRSILEMAITDYNTAKSPSTATAAAYIISRIGEPSDIARLNYRTNLEVDTNRRLVSVIRNKGGDPEAFDFVEGFYKDHIRERPSFQYLTCIRAFEEIGDPRALPYLRELLKLTERKQDAATAIGNLMLDRRVSRPEQDTDRRHRQHLYELQQNTPTAEDKAAALAALLQDPERAMQLAVSMGRVGELLSAEPRLAWQSGDEKQLTWISRFGDTAARQILQATQEKPLATRYRAAKLLSVHLSDSLPLICKTALNPAVSDDERRTSIRALGLIGGEESIVTLKELLDEEALRGNVIDALAHLGTEPAQTQLNDLHQRLTHLEQPSFHQRVWLRKVTSALKRDQ